MIIVLEGLDGVGKSSACLALARALGAASLSTPTAEVRAFRERFDGAFRDPLARSVAYAATVVEAGRRARQLVQSGRPVVIDRYWLSTLVYAERPEALAGLGEAVEAPDLTLYLHAPLALRRARLRARGPLHEHDLHTLIEANDARLDRLYRGLLRHRAAGEGRLIDASGGPEEVLAAMLGAVSAATEGQRRGQLLLFAA